MIRLIRIGYATFQMFLYEYVPVAATVRDPYIFEYQLF